ncbi:MAG: cell division topological specificity factor MinE [Clostridiales bacterium]|nr:cell division topological specificity factor MinE [Clostridiales bacterium]
MMKSRWRFHKSNSGQIALRRLRFLLVCDETQVSPALLETIRDDMTAVLSRYADIDPAGLEFELVRAKSGAGREQPPLLCTRVPIRPSVHMRKPNVF